MGLKAEGLQGVGKGESPGAWKGSVRMYQIYRSLQKLEPRPCQGFLDSPRYSSFIVHAFSSSQFRSLLRISPTL